jgi:hypothetical protein
MSSGYMGGGEGEAGGGTLPFPKVVAFSALRAESVLFRVLLFAYIYITNKMEIGRIADKIAVLAETCSFPLHPPFPPLFTPPSRREPSKAPQLP